MEARILACMAAAAIALASCMKEPEPSERPAVPDGKSTVTFIPRPAEPTRSSISPDETALRDITVAAYRDGKLFATAGGNSPSMEIFLGYSYNLYALANCGKVDPPASEDEFRRHAVHISSVADMQDGIPMVWSRTGWTPAPHSKQQRLDIILERMASRISFTLDKGTLKGLTVSSVRLMSSPLTVHPFTEGGSRVTRASETGNGDHAVAADLQRLNAGGAITFYTLENCQGVLLPGNTDPWKKVPDSISDRKDLCTWIEVKGSFDPGSFFSGDVTWRIYPGRDNCTDFTLGRNTDIGITLYVTGPGLKEISWKVDANVSIDQTSASAAVVGPHSADDLYLGERFDCVLDISRDLLDYLGGNVDGIGVQFVPAGQGGAVDLGPLRRDGSDLRYRSRACCMETGRGDIYLTDRDGSRLMKVCGGLLIQEPHMVVSDFASVGDTERSESYVQNELPVLIINGQSRTSHIYFTDGWGFNLNSTDSDYNLDIFDFYSSMGSDPNHIAKSISRVLTRGTSSSGGPVVTCTATCTNDGTDGQLNRDLRAAVNEEYESFAIDINEHNHRLKTPVPWGMYIQPVEVTIVDNGWAGYFYTTNSVKVKNPSNIELEIEFMQAMSARKSFYGAPSDSFVKDILSKIYIQESEYVCASSFNGIPDLDPTVHYNHLEPLFVMEGRRITSNPAPGYGSEKTVDGEYYVHPVEDLDVDLLERGLKITGDACGTPLLNDMLFNLVRVNAPGMAFYPTALTCRDLLSDGSMSYNIIYGKDDGGYNDRGIWSWADIFTDERASADMDAYDLDYDDILEMRNDAMNITLTYDQTTGKLYAASSNPNQLTLDFKFTIKCEGYCKVKPEGAGSKEHFPTESVTRKVTGIRLGDTRTAIDDGALKEAMDLVYARTYQHRDRPLAKRKYIHATPEKILMTVQMKISGTGTRKQKVYTNMTNLTTIMYYHEQNARNCIVLSDVRTGNYRIHYIYRK